MRNASRVFYLLTGILSIIAFVTLLIIAIVGFVAAVPAIAEDGEAVEALIPFIVVSIYALLELVAAIIGFHGNKLSRSGSPKQGFHIFCLVLGVIFMNPFLFLAGLFGLIGAAQ